jgi:hypothetical protein
MKQTQLNLRCYSILIFLALINLTVDSFAANDVTMTGSPVLISTSPSIAGKTPGRIGAGGILDPHFLHYSGVNAVRTGFVSNMPYGFKNQKDPYPWGEGVTDLASFNANRAKVRTDPEGNNLIPWDVFAKYFSQNLNYSLLSAVSCKTDILLLMTRYVEPAYGGAYHTNPSERWADKWEEWLNRYASAFYMAKTFGVYNFELYNEPHDKKITFNASIPEYIERMQIGSDAVQCAVADVNKLYGKNLVANVTGPVCHGEQFWKVPGGDPRDDTMGWGEATIKNLHTTYEGKVDSSFFLVNSYCYHLYTNSRTIPNVVGAVDYNRQQIRSLTNTYLPIWVSEWNVHTNDNFSKIPQTLDSPTKFSNFAATLGAYVETGLENLFVFKSDMTDTNYKNGMYYVSKSVPATVGGLSRSAELLHLFAPAFTNKQRFQKPAISIGSDSIFVTACNESAASYRYLWVTNISSQPIPLNIDLSRWSLPTIKARFIQEVSEKSFGEVKSWNTATPAKPIVDSIPAYGTWLVSLYSGSSLMKRDIKATDDATVTGGILANTNFGASKTLDVSNHTTDFINHNVTFIKFPLSGISKNETIKRSIFRVAAQKATHLNPSPAKNKDIIVVHVYGLTNNNWNEKTITWDSAPNLLKNSLIGGSDARVDHIKDNFVTGIGTTAVFLGQITVSDTALTERALDISDFVSAQKGVNVTIMLVREVRADLDALLPNRLDDVWRMRIQSKENTSGNLAPTLSVFTQKKSNPDL